MSKLGEANARLKQLEIALESAELDKRNVESETALAKEMDESLKLEIKKLESKVGASAIYLLICLLLLNFPF